MRGLLILNIVLLFFYGRVMAEGTDSLHCTDKVFDERIKTVQLYKEGWNLSYPVMKLKGTEKLVLQFDLLADHSETYYYTIFHCTKDWKRSDIFTSDYLEGFPENPIEDYMPSFNTTVDYFHYKLLLPNDRINIRLSGNYILKVYPADDQDNPVLTRRFIVTEDLAKVDIKAHRPMMTSSDNAGQQIDFTVNTGGLNIIDPDRNIYSFILQNGRWDNAKKNLKPDLSGNNALIYNSLSDNNIFIAGNEFRYFDIRSIKYLSEYVFRIDFIAPNYNIYLKPSESRQFKPYFYSQDFNGKYYIASSEGRDAATDADYLYVYFTLRADNIPDKGRMYIVGDLTSWSLGDNNRMTWNPVERQYESTLLLKQGWYNYEYVFVKDNNYSGKAEPFEGSHYETENDYLVLVYYSNPRDRYDRVIATATLNTLNNLSY
ncbi:MAG: DUF5103 domain-containing protein [Bacteroidales bacterium]|nr:DUF5103 domain-containing protein [Bacteroidales bacterium]